MIASARPSRPEYLGPSLAARHVRFHGPGPILTACSGDTDTDSDADSGR